VSTGSVENTLKDRSRTTTVYTAVSSARLVNAVDERHSSAACDADRMVSGFLKTLTGVIDFGATAEAVPVLAAMRQMPDLLRRRRELTAADIDGSLVHGPWRRLVFGCPPTGRVEKNAYVFCVRR
jgi:hypothetical protein